MDTLTTFDSIKVALQDLLVGIKDGKIQLPDFQRGWVWDDDHVRSLLASLSLSYPIGAIMMLQTGNPNVRFKPRLVEGVSLTNPPEPERLILDGQQRLTSLFQSLLMGQPVDTRDPRGKPIRRWYYLDIAKALDPNGNREEAIIGLPEDRIVRNFRGEPQADYSTLEKECEAGLLPLSIVFNIAALTNWQMKYFQQDPTNIQERLTIWNELTQKVIQRFQQYQVPVIVLYRETPKEAVCQVFEKVNTGGVSLTVFELLTATYAADDFNLRDDWANRSKRFKALPALHNLESTDFLQALTLLATQERRNRAVANGTEVDKAPGISCKRKDILELTVEDYNNFADAVTEGFERTARLLYSQKIFSARDIPYQTQLTPLAAILAVLGNASENDGVKEKLKRWYWCGVLGELYGSAVESRFAKDLPEVLGWIKGGPEPDTVVAAHFAPARLLTLRTRTSAAYKGIYALLLRDGALDFRTGDPIDTQLYFDDKIDIHHIFPQAWCKTHGIDSRRCDSIINKTPISAKTNRIVSGNAPSVYLGRLEKLASIDQDRLDSILSSHVVKAEALRQDDFQAFFQARESALLSRIEKAMGKAIARDAVELEEVTPVDYQDEEEAA